MLPILYLQGQEEMADQHHENLSCDLCFKLLLLLQYFLNEHAHA